MSNPVKWFPRALLVLAVFAAGLCVGRGQSAPRPSAGAPPGLSGRLVIDYPVHGFPSRRTVTLRVDRVVDGSGEVVFDRPSGGDGACASVEDRGARILLLRRAGVGLSRVVRTRSSARRPSTHRSVSVATGTGRALG